MELITGWVVGIALRVEVDTINGVWVEVVVSSDLHPCRTLETETNTTRTIGVVTVTMLLFKLRM